MNAEPRTFGTVRSYDDLIEVLRNAVTARGITFSTIDEVSGLQSGYSAKLLAPVPTKHLGPMSLGSLLGAIGVQLVAVADDAQMARVHGRHEKRKRGMLNTVEHEVITVKKTRKMMARMGRKSAKMRMLKITAKRRQMIAKRAARARWFRVRRTASGRGRSSGEAT